MAKKVASSVAVQMKKPMIKHSSKRRKLRTIFKNVINYMKSDTYMFAPLLHPPQSTLTSSHASFDEVSFKLPVKRKEKKRSLKDVEEYMRCDCYMYAPLVVDSASEKANPPAGVPGQSLADTREKQTEPRLGVTRSNHGNTSTESEHVRTSCASRRIAVRHVALQQETVKRVVHQNCSSSSEPGVAALSQKETRKIAVE